MIFLVERRDVRRIGIVVVFAVVFVWIAAAVIMMMMIRSLRSRPLDSGSVSRRRVPGRVHPRGVVLDKMIGWLVGWLPFLPRMISNVALLQ